MALIAVAGVTPAVRAQMLPAPPDPSASKHPKMHAVLREAHRELAGRPEWTAEQRRDALRRRGLQVTEGRVHVEIVAPEGVEAAPRVNPAAFGGQVHGAYRNRVDVWLPPERLLDVAEALPEGFVLERASVPMLDQVAGEGPGDNVVNSDGYRDNGRNGTGLTIAIFDTEWQGLTAARNNGDAPTAANTTTMNYAGGTFESGSTSDPTHGVGCLEAVFDHAPGATYRLYKVSSATDVGTAVTDAIANGVDVISHSMSWYNLGWADNTGAACTAANQASNAGILFVTSAGNRAQDHWQGNFNAGAGDANWHDWATGDETLTLSVQPNSTASFSMAWNTAGGTFDYDLYLYDSSMNLLTAGLNAGNAFESISWTNSSASAVTVNLAVQRYSGGVTEFEIFGNNNTTSFQYVVAANSTTSPSNATGNNVLSIGAVPQNSYNSANGTNPIASYSSQGPSNGGMTLPDLVGPTNTTGFTYPGGFGGTSCATPNVAGALCAFWSDRTAFTATAVGWLVGQIGRNWHDWGVLGTDNVYGGGPCRIVDYAANTTWVAKPFGNIFEQSTGPYYTFFAGYSAVPAGGRIMMIPGSVYPENLTLSKVVRIEGWGGASTIGQ